MTDRAKYKNEKLSKQENKKPNLLDMVNNLDKEEGDSDDDESYSE